MALATRKSGSAVMGRHRSRHVACFECGVEVEVTYAAKTASCPECESEINLNDYDITKDVFDNILTRGNVMINKLGSLTCERLVCHNLKAFGRLQAAIDSTGDVMIRSNIHIPGDLRCQHLMVGRDCHVQVDGDVIASEMEIGGLITANAFQCSGSVSIGDRGAINGPLQTKSIAMEDGGCLNGTLQIVMPPKQK